jgi:hypothetical protein
MIAAGMPTTRRPARDFGAPSTSSPVERSTNAPRTLTAPALRSIFASAQCGRLTPPQARERRQQHQGTVTTIMIGVGETRTAHVPQGPFGGRASGKDLRMRVHPPVPGVPEPVAADHLADVAERTTAEQIGKLKDLGHGEHRPLPSLLVTSSADAAGVAREDLVLVHGGGEHGPQQPVSLCGHGDRNPRAKQLAPPLPDHRRGELAQWHPAEGGSYVLPEQPEVQV